MIYVWAAGVTVLNIVWWTLNLVGLPGNWLMLATAGLAAWLAPGTGMFSAWTLAAAAALNIAGELVEFLAGMVGAKGAGATRKGAWGALGGGLVGAILGTFMIPVPLIGSLIGAGVGAAVGAALLELSGGRDVNASVKSGVGAGAGRVLGTVCKMVIGALVWVILTVAAFWP